MVVRTERYSQLRFWNRTQAALLLVVMMSGSFFFFAQVLDGKAKGSPAVKPFLDALSRSAPAKSK